MINKEDKMAILVLILSVFSIIYWKKNKKYRREKYIKKQVKKAIRSIKDGQEHIGLNIKLRSGGKI
jgi:sensor domain CHASE-containing protein